MIVDRGSLGNGKSGPPGRRGLQERHPGPFHAAANRGRPEIAAIGKGFRARGSFGDALRPSLGQPRDIPGESPGGPHQAPAARRPGKKNAHRQFWA